MNSISFGKYHKFIVRAIHDMEINEDDHILDLGCGTGKNAELMAAYLGESGAITGVDLSSHMEKQFIARHEADERINFIRSRIDLPMDLEKKFDKVLISFVIHGFPQEVREAILKNAHEHLKPGGKLMILDFAEFSLDSMPFHHRVIFKAVECKYAFDFIEKDWTSILSGKGFKKEREQLYFRNYARLLTVSKQ